MTKKSALWRKYKLEGEKVKRDVMFCSICGEGYVMGEYEDRYYCGKCHHVVYKTR